MFVLVNANGKIVFAGPTLANVVRLAAFFNARPARVVFGTIQFIEVPA
jgi:hypothetical protein